MDLYLKTSEYMEYYNFERRHKGINDQIPKELFNEK
jgi:hypothetical protein